MIQKGQKISAETFNSAFLCRMCFASDQEYQDAFSVLELWPDLTRLHMYLNSTTGALRYFDKVTGEWKDVGSDVNKEEVTQTGHGFSVGDQIGHNSSGYFLADNLNVSDLAQWTVVQLIDADTFCKQRDCIAVIPGHGYTVGEHYYSLDGTLGGVTSTMPTSGYDRPAFYVIDANTLQIENDIRPVNLGGTVAEVNKIAVYAQNNGSGLILQPSVSTTVAFGVIEESDTHVTDNFPINGNFNYTINETGKYIVDFRSFIGSITATSFYTEAEILHNGVVVVQDVDNKTSGSNRSVHAVYIRTLSVGDILEFRIYQQNSSNTTALLPGIQNTNRISIMRVS